MVKAGGRETGTATVAMTRAMITKSLAVAYNVCKQKLKLPKMHIIILYNEYFQLQKIMLLW